MKLENLLEESLIYDLSIVTINIDVTKRYINMIGGHDNLFFLASHRHIVTV